MKIRRGITQVNSNSAIVFLACGSAMLALNTRRLGAFLGKARLVYNPDGTGVHMVVSHNLVNTISHGLVIPPVLSDELLQRAWIDARLVSHRFDTFARQIGQLPTDISASMFDRFPPPKAIREQLHVRRQLWPNTLDLVHRHRRSSKTDFDCPEECYRLSTIEK